MLGQTLAAIAWHRIRVALLLLLFVVAAAPRAEADSVQYFYDPAGHLIGLIDPINGSSLYSLDATGNILSIATNPITALVVVQASPSSGAVGTSVQIFGTGFGTSANTSVSFNGVAAAPTAVTATSITVTVPSGVTSGPITVTAPGGTAATAANFTVGAPQVPVIASLSATTSAPGAALTINGSNFDPVLTNNKVYVSNQLAQVTSVSAGAISIIVPQTSTGQVQVETPQGGPSNALSLVVAPSGYSASAVTSSSQITFPTASGSLATAVSIPAAGDVALIYFNVPPGQNISTFVSSATIGGNLALYGPTGLQVTTTGLGTGAFLDSTLNTLVPGTYTLAASSNSSSSGSANLTIYNTADVIGSISANGTPVTLTTSVPGQNMRLSFVGAAGARISMKTQTGAGLLGGRGFTITGPDGGVIYNTSGPQSFTDVLVLPVSGVYSVYFDLWNRDYGSVTFTLYTVPPDVTSTISLDGTPATLTTTAPGQNMQLTFVGAAGTRVSMRASTGLGRLGARGFTITAPDGSSFFSTSDSQFFTDVLVLPMDGTYTAYYDLSSADYAAVTFTLYTVPPDVTSTISLDGTPATLTTTTPGQNMQLTFVGAAGTRISMRSSTGLGRLGARGFTIYAPDGSTFFNTTNSQFFTDVLILPTNGTYTTYYDLWSADYAAVTFTLYTVPPDATSTISLDGTPVTLTTTVPGQNMLLTFTGTAGTRVSMQDTTGLGRLGTKNFTLTAPNGAVIYNTTNSQFFTDVVILPQTGTYSAYYDLWWTDYASVTFKLYTVPPDASATISPGATVSLTSTEPGQNFGLTFSETAGHRFSLLASYPNSCGVNLTVTAPDGTTTLVNHQNECTPDFTGVVPVANPLTVAIPMLTQTGTYSVALNPPSTSIGTAQFTLYDVSADVSGSMNIGDPAGSYSTTVPGQAARVSFAGSASQSVTVAVGETASTPSGGCYRITVLEPNGSTILRGDSSCNASYSSGSLTLPSAGTYTIVVSPTGTTIGTYSVGVTTP